MEVPPHLGKKSFKEFILESLMIFAFPHCRTGGAKLSCHVEALEV
jgi:hypothetical protein